MITREELFVEQVLTSLKIISMIKEGQKVCVRNGFLSLENKSVGLMVAIRRWIHKDNRVSTLTYIKNIINTAFDILGIHGDVLILNKLKTSLKISINGLRCLSVTYNDDAAITASIEVLIDRIDVL